MNASQHSSEFLELQAALAGEYVLERELGQGGMGIVYLAREVHLDRDVAIKVLPAQLARDASARERFLHEARTAARLSHPHIVPIHRVGEAGGFVFIVMSYIDGETLGERLRTRGPLPAGDAARMLREVAWALAYAHGRGVVHRDVKPDNILLEAGTGRALVTDFGIAQAGTSGTADTAANAAGTVAFMSPEQAAGESVDGRSDIFALGVVGYLAVSGRLPFDAKNLPALLVSQVSDQPPSVAAVAPGLPRALGNAIDVCLARDPEDRFPDGEALAAALAPTYDARPALPATLRAWLGAKNPLALPYLGWSGLFSVLTVGNFVAYLSGNPGSSIGDLILLIALTTCPALPVVGYHLNQARKQFRAGHSLADLRAAIEVAEREQAEAEVVEQADAESLTHRMLRLATAGSATWFATTMGFIMTGVVNENNMGIIPLLLPVASTMLFGAISNALDVQFIPTGIRKGWQQGIRDRLWNSRIGEWFAERLGAPRRSMLAGPAAFRATESALGVAASELFDALPEKYRAHLPGLPEIVAALEARAAEARAEIAVVDSLVSAGSAAADVITARRNAAAAHLAETVAALERIRVDLLRLHAGASDLEPLATVLDAARVIADEMDRLAAAQQEAEAFLRRPTPTAG